jgi:hypothetical protein
LKLENRCPARKERRAAKPKYRNKKPFPDSGRLKTKSPPYFSNNNQGNNRADFSPCRLFNYAASCEKKFPLKR